MHLQLALLSLPYVISPLDDYVKYFEILSQLIGRPPSPHVIYHISEPHISGTFKKNHIFMFFLLNKLEVKEKVRIFGLQFKKTNILCWTTKNQNQREFFQII